jgi:hypothetical protein
MGATGFGVGFGLGAGAGSTGPGAGAEAVGIRAGVDAASGFGAGLDVGAGGLAGASTRGGTIATVDGIGRARKPVSIPARKLPAATTKTPPVFLRIRALEARFSTDSRLSAKTFDSASATTGSGGGAERDVRGGLPFAGDGT